MPFYTSLMPLDPLADPRIFVWPKIPLLLFSLHSLTCGAHTSASSSTSFLVQPPLHALLTQLTSAPGHAARAAGLLPGRAPPPPGEPLPRLALRPRAAERARRRPRLSTLSPPTMFPPLSRSSLYLRLENGRSPRRCAPSRDLLAPVHDVS